MSIEKVVVHVICDKCGSLFHVEMELATPGQSDWSLYDYAVDAVRGSLQYTDHRGYRGIMAHSSVQDEQHLCGTCTDEVDEQGDV